ncbi:MAG: hypothetical protein R2853_21015 [Thermomicrobiales bacterium]
MARGAPAGARGSRRASGATHGVAGDQCARNWLALGRETCVIVMTVAPVAAPRSSPGVAELPVRCQHWRE